MECRDLDRAVEGAPHAGHLTVDEHRGQDVAIAPDDVRAVRVGQHPQRSA